MRNEIIVFDLHQMTPALFPSPAEFPTSKSR